MINIPFMMFAMAGIFTGGVGIGLWIARKKLQLARALKTAANAEMRACQWIEHELHKANMENAKLREGIGEITGMAQTAAALSEAQGGLGR